MRRVVGACIAVLIAAALVASAAVAFPSIRPAEEIGVVSFDGGQTEQVLSRTYFWKNGFAITIRYFNGWLPFPTFETGFDVSDMDDG